MAEQFEVDQNLPRSTTSFIGRDRDLAAISALLRDPNCRLLTLVGPGGIGKTRLALEVARRNLTDFSDSAYFVPLQPLESADHVVTAIIDVLPLQLMEHEDPEQRLMNYLSKKHLLLVLDNFEHLLDGVDIVLNILKVTFQVKLLITSRERLDLRAEQVWPVGGLDVPLDATDTLDQHSAVRLFVERAQQVEPDFALDAHSEAVVRVCQQVEGLPLALELAASWVRVMPCASIADKLQRNIDFLSTNQRDVSERHRSMRAVFEHSWQLLSDAEQTVFRRLAVFHGGFTEEAAQAVAGASLRTLAALIDKSLVRLEASGRYDLHELVRQYAEQQLEIVSETEKVFDKHCEYYNRFMHEREAALKGPRQNEALNEIEADFENVRAAWQRAVQSNNHLLINAAVESLFLFCTLRSRFQDHRTLFQSALTEFAPRGRDDAAITWGRIVARSYRFLPFTHTGPSPETTVNIQTALRIAQSHGNQPETAFCLHLLGILTLTESDAQALALLEESLQHYIACKEVFYRAYLLQGIGECHHRLGQIEQYIAKERECLELCRTHGLQSPMGITLSLLGMHETYRYGNFIEGEHYVREAVKLYRSLNSPGETIRILRWLSTIVFVHGHFDEARRLAEECRAVANDLHDPAFLNVPLAVLGMVFNAQGEYRQGKTLGQESLQYLAKPPGEGGFFAEWSIGCAYCGLDDIQAATDHLQVALQYANNHMLQLGFTALCVPIAAFIYARMGKSERSTELLALALTHPNSPSGWLEKWSLITELCAELEAELGREVYTAAWTRGTSLDLESTHQRVLHELKSDQTTPDLRVNQQLIEPLSPRELEVLALITEDLTNHEIADRLYISISTVKKHVNHIYSKLDVKDRIEVVDYATKLGLIS